MFQNRSFVSRIEASFLDWSLFLVSKLCFRLVNTIQTQNLFPGSKPRFVSRSFLSKIGALFPESKFRLWNRSFISGIKLSYSTCHYNSNLELKKSFFIFIRKWKTKYSFFFRNWKSNYLNKSILILSSLSQVRCTRYSRASSCQAPWGFPPCIGLATPTIRRLENSCCSVMFTLLAATFIFNSFS